MPVALALALGPRGLAPAAQAQEERLPSVSDYRLPNPSARPTTRPQGPIDRDNPVVLRPRGEPAAEPSAAAHPPEASPSPSAPSTSAGTVAPPTASPASDSAPGTARSPAASAPAPRAAGSAPRAGSAAGAAPPGGTAVVAPAAGAPAARAPGDLPQPPASGSNADGPVPPIQWNLHSAKEAAGSSIWPWLAGIAALLASNALLLFMLLRRRQARAAAEFEAAQSAQLSDHPHEPVRAQGEAAPSQIAEPESETEADEELELLALLEHSEPAQPASKTPVSGDAATRPALDLIVNPLDVTLAARRLSATLMNTVLNYELVIANNSDGPIGPVTVAGDMIGAHASLPTRMQLEMSGNDIAPQHRIEQLGPGESTTVSGELRLPLAAITPIRSGNASLFVPLARFRVEALRDTEPPLAVNRTFVVGESPDRPDAALKPFRLDLGPRLYSRLGQREVAAIA